MQKSNSDTPLPNPGQIIKFLCRSFSHVDDRYDKNTSKSLKRFASGSPRDSKDAFKTLYRQIKPTYEAVGRQNSIVLKDSFKRAWQSYILVVRNLRCRLLPKREVVRILDEHLFSFLFEDLLEFALKPLGLSLSDILGKPETITATVWSAFQGGDTNYQTSKKLAEDFGISSDEGWRKRLEGYHGGGNVSVQDILRISRVEQDLGFALLVANAYGRYCDLPYMKECIAGHSLADSNKANGEKWLSKLQETLNRENQDFANSFSLPHDFLQVFASAESLTSEKRIKQHGDLIEAERHLDELKYMTEELPRGLSDMSMRGHFYIQSRNLERALEAFEDYCEYAKLRDGPMLKAGLKRLLPLAVLLNRNKLINDWGKWGSFFDLEVNLQKDRAGVLLRKMFPNTYANVDENLNVKLIDFGFFEFDKWTNKKPNCRYPNRKFRGISNIPRPQISVFAGFGQSEKVAKLLSSEANVNVADDDGATPLICAVQGGCHKCVDMILAQTSNKFLHAVTNRRHQHALSAAIDRSDVVIARKILESRFKVDLPGEDNQTSLFAVMRGICPIPEGSLNHSEKALRRYADGRPPGFAQTASPFRRDQIEADRKFLTANEKLLKTVGRVKQKQLSEVAFEMILLLLDFGADIHAVHEGGYTSLRLAREIGFTEIHETMLSHSKL